MSHKQLDYKINEYRQHHRTSSLFFETTSAQVYQQGFMFRFRNPVEHVVGWRIRQIVIYAYSGIDSHHVYVLLCGLVSGQTPSFWNGQSISVAKTIIRNRTTDDSFLKDPDPEWHMVQEQDINNVWFELRDETLAPVVTNFFVEIEVKHI